MKTSLDKTLFLLVAMGLTLLSAHIDVAYEVIPHSDVDVCDLLLGDTCDASACCDEPGHGNDNCCESGCQHCSLPCCSGTAMIPAVAQMVDATLDSGRSPGRRRFRRDLGRSRPALPPAPGLASFFQVFPENSDRR